LSLGVDFPGKMIAQLQLGGQRREEMIICFDSLLFQYGINFLLSGGVFSFWEDVPRCH